MSYEFRGFGAATATPSGGNPVDMGVEVRGNLRYVPAALVPTAVAALGQMHSASPTVASGYVALLPGPPAASPPGMDPNWVMAQLNAGNAVLMSTSAPPAAFITKVAAEIVPLAHAGTGTATIVVIPPALDAQAQAMAAAPPPTPVPVPPVPNGQPPAQQAAIAGGGLPSWALPVGLAAAGAFGLYLLLK